VKKTHNTTNYLFCEGCMKSGGGSSKGPLQGHPTSGFSVLPSLLSMLWDLRARSNEGPSSLLWRLPRETSPRPRKSMTTSMTKNMTQWKVMFPAAFSCWKSSLSLSHAVCIMSFSITTIYSAGKPTLVFLMYLFSLLTKLCIQETYHPMIWSYLPT
jgi:hypothetical protein